MNRLDLVERAMPLVRETTRLHHTGAFKRMKLGWESEQWLHDVRQEDTP